MSQWERGRIGPNDLCWCGSGKKFKRCHRDRSDQARLTTQEIHEGQQQAAAIRTCLAAAL